MLPITVAFKEPWYLNNVTLGIQWKCFGQWLSSGFSQGFEKTNGAVCELGVFDGSVKMWLCHGQERRFPKMPYVS